jgi:hypothetical protein
MFIKRMILILLLGLTSVQSYSAEDVSDMTRDVRNLVDWIVDSVDHQQLPFIVIDKKEAKVFVFQPDGKSEGATSALIGTTIGDKTTPGVGLKKISEISLEERTTPAGRFEADLGFDLRRSELLWIDYESGFSMHVVLTANASERRLQRLTSENTADHRITYGCINVSSHFYKEVIHRIFKNSKGIVYILPEIDSVQKVFGTEAARYSQR